MSGNKSNLIKIHRCFEKICYAPDGLEQLNWYERYTNYNDIETVRINSIDRFSFKRSVNYIFVKSLIGYPKDYNYYL
jgi:hypothetical protein